MPRFMHPTQGHFVDVPDHDKGLIRYYQREGYRSEQDWPGFGEPMHGTEAPLDQQVEITNDVPDDEPGESTIPDSDESVGTSLEL